MNVSYFLPYRWSSIELPQMSNTYKIPQKHFLQLTQNEKDVWNQLLVHPCNSLPRIGPSSQCGPNYKQGIQGYDETDKLHRQ